MDGWTSISAGQLRRDLRLLLIVLSLEAGRAPDLASGALRRATFRAAAMARAASRVLTPVLLRIERTSNQRSGRMFRIVDQVDADPATPDTAAPGRTFQARLRAGRMFDGVQSNRYNFNQIYVLKDGGKDYWILDSYGPFDPAFGAGPVSRKFTQLADIRVESAKRMLQEAYRKYRPGQRFADVPSRPFNLQDTIIQGQLWLEVPVQTRPIPDAVLGAARQFSVKIRDITGKIYQ